MAPTLRTGGPCPKHVGDHSIPVVYYLDDEPCYGCHPELVGVSPTAPAYVQAVEAVRHEWAAVAS